MLNFYKYFKKRLDFYYSVILQLRYNIIKGILYKDLYWVLKPHR